MDPSGGILGLSVGLFVENFNTLEPNFMGIYILYNMVY